MNKHEMAPFPWQAAMSFGFGVLKLNAAEFWAMTPLELASAMRAHGYHESHPLKRTTLHDLMTRFPDKKQAD